MANAKGSKSTKPAAKKRVAKKAVANKKKAAAAEPETGGGGGVDENHGPRSDHDTERRAAKQILCAAWQCRAIEAAFQLDGFEVDWIFVRRDKPSALCSYQVHTENGNVLVPMWRWHGLRRWSVEMLIPHVWVIDCGEEGLHYLKYPPHSGVRHETIVIDELVYVEIPRKSFLAMKEN